MKKGKSYGLMTTIAMIVGVVIGSGIYFKVDDILNYAGGNVGLGMLIIALGSFAIVFGSLSISELAVRHSEAGGYFLLLCPLYPSRFGHCSGFVYVLCLHADGHCRHHLGGGSLYSGRSIQFRGPNPLNSFFTWLS